MVTGPSNHWAKALGALSSVAMYARKLPRELHPLMLIQDFVLDIEILCRYLLPSCLPCTAHMAPYTVTLRHTAPPR